MEDSVDAATAAITIQIQVPFAAILAAIFFKDRFGWRRSLGLLIAFAGVALIAGEPRLEGQYVSLLCIIAAAAICMLPALHALHIAISPPDAESAVTLDPEVAKRLPLPTVDEHGRPDPLLAVIAVIEQTQQTPNMIWIGLFALMLMLAYVIGHLFYRRDPKVPDRASFLRLKRDAELARPQEHYRHDYAEAVRKLGSDRFYRIDLLAIRLRYVVDLIAMFLSGPPPLNDDRLKRDFGCLNVDDCEFPYPYLSSYLRHREHEHLAKIADRWNPEQTNGNARSKTYINRLKIRLSYRVPSKYRTVVRNEAHVRLSTSTWYMARTLWQISLLAALVLGLAAGISPAHGIVEEISWVLAAAIPMLMVAGIAFFARRSTERFIHYQRLREAFYVLELAHTASSNPPIIDHERRQHHRQKADRDVTLVQNEHRWTGRLTNASRSGLAVEIPSQASLPQMDDVVIRSLGNGDRAVEGQVRRIQACNGGFLLGLALRDTERLPESADASS